MNNMTNREMLSTLNDEEFSQAILKSIKEIKKLLNFNEIYDEKLVEINFEEWLEDEAI